MTCDELITLLKESGADAWELTDIKTEGWEFYFIGKKLDQNRVRDVEHMSIKVYRTLKEGKMLGTASGEIDPTLSRDEAKKRITDILKDAEYVINPYYELNKPAETVENMQEVDLAAIAKDYLETIKNIRRDDNSFINSCEVFADKCHSRFVNSEGIDVTQIYPSSMLEVVVNARNADKEIELYRLYTAGTCDRSALTRDIEELMRFGVDRLDAKPTPALEKTAVLFSTRDAVELYKWFVSKLSANFRYMNLSDWEIGNAIAPSASGDRLTLTARAFIEGSSKNRSVDNEGAPTADIVLMENGVPVQYWGSRQFRSYLGIDDGYIAMNFEAGGGTGTKESLRSGSYMEIVEFSDFSVDDVTGDIAGEIRLGYWHDSGKVTPVSGGSISGSLTELINEMRFSGAARHYDNYLIPELTRLEGVNITGIRTE